MLMTSFAGTFLDEVQSQFKSWLQTIDSSTQAAADQLRAPINNIAVLRLVIWLHRI